MKYRKIPNTDLNVSETGLGTWTLVSNRWGSLSEESSIKLVHTALDLGINLFDTADQYGSGNNEEVVAKALKGQRNNVVLCTKAGEGAVGCDEHDMTLQQPKKLPSSD